MMIVDFILARKIRKAAYCGETGMCSLTSVRKAAVLLDVEDADFEECRKRVSDFFAAERIDLRLFYVDFRKMSRDEIITTSVQTTLTRRRLGLLGLPDKDYMAEVTSLDGVELFICLAHSCHPAVRMIAAAMPARFKVGVMDYSDSPYSMVVRVRETGEPAARVGDNCTFAATETVLENLKKII